LDAKGSFLVDDIFVSSIGDCFAVALPLICELPDAWLAGGYQSHENNWNSTLLDEKLHYQHMNSKLYVFNNMIGI
jgi:hypothetical protein